MSGGYVVTGASSGIGAHVARQLLSRGDRVLAVARRDDLLRDVCGDNPAARHLSADLCDDGAVDRVAAAAGEFLGRVKGFVHCAGFSSPAPVGMIDAAVAQNLFKVHALFPLRFLGWMMKSVHHEADAACVLMTSLAVHRPTPGNAAYAAAKGAVEGLLPSVAAELAGRGIRVNAVDPGIVDTDMVRETWMRTMPPARLEELRADCPNGFRSPDAVAEAILGLLDDASGQTGRVVTL